MATAMEDTDDVHYIGSHFVHDNVRPMSKLTRTLASAGMTHPWMQRQLFGSLYNFGNSLFRAAGTNGKEILENVF